MTSDIIYSQIELFFLNSNFYTNKLCLYQMTNIVILSGENSPVDVFAVELCRPQSELVRSEGGRAATAGIFFGSLLLR